MKRGCRLGVIGATFAVLVASAGPSPAQVPGSLRDSAFGALSAELSEAGGFFDTDNLVSNEDSYLHPITTLQKLGIRGGAYLGVGPDQNFSYIAAIRPKIAFIIDIRRDNLLEHLLYKSIFALSRDRAEYLALLFGKAAPPDTAGWGGKSPAELLQYIEGAATDSSRILSRVLDKAGKLGIPLSASDRQTIAKFHRIFIQRGPSLRLSTFNRSERSDYPDFRELVLQTDLAGRHSSYLASESAFQVVSDLQNRNLVVPLVGNFSGNKAVIAVGKYLKAHGEKVSMFYTSNVEEYLVRDGSIDKFAQNVNQLPRDTSTVIVRSYFPYGRQHPQWVQGYLTVQIVQRMERFLVHRNLVSHENGYTSYYDLVTTDIVEPK